MQPSLIYPPFYQTYISKIDTGVDLLIPMEEGLRAVMSMFKFMSDEKSKFRYAEEKWSVKEVFGHMIDTERIMAFRALCIARGEKNALPGFDENAYVEHANFMDQPLGDMLEHYKMVRYSNILLKKTFSDAILDRKGIANGNEMNVRALMYIIVGHEKHHMEILRERYGVK